MPGAVTAALDHSVVVEMLSLLEKITLLLLGVLYGDHHTEDKGKPTLAALRFQMVFELQSGFQRRFI